MKNNLLKFSTPLTIFFLGFIAYMQFPNTNKNVSFACPASKYESYTSYNSQYYEDYILAYIFPGSEKLFYVDVGAHSPRLDSITKYFYDKGWTGINIEPNPKYTAVYNKERKRDINLNIGASNKKEIIDFYQVTLDRNNSQALNSFSKSDIEKVKKIRPKASIKKIKVQVDTLANIFKKNKPKNIAFMNIDVEGYEKNVLEGMDFSKNRPKVILIESVSPMIEKANYDAWEYILLKNKYIFAMDDGLNRYYLDINHKDLLNKFIKADYCVKKSKISRNVKFNGYYKI